MRINKKLCVLLSAVMLALCSCRAAFAKEAAHDRRISLPPGPTHTQGN